MVPAAIFLVVVLATALWSRHLVDGPITPPTILAVAGLVAALASGDAVDVDTAGFRLASEITLSLVLFVDATRIPLRALRRAERLPARLLGIGLPLSIALLTATAMVVLGLDLGPALLVGAALSATDAALARIVVESESCPRGLRETINVESGLNDGLATPVVTIAIALTATEALGPRGLVPQALAALALAVGIGLAFGLAGGWALRWAEARGQLDPVYTQLVGLGLVGLVVVASTMTGAITFVAAFLAGSAFRQAHGGDTGPVMAVTEDLARLLTVGAFFAFGLVLLPDALAAVTPGLLVVVLVALTVARMAPVAAAMLGTGLRPPSVALVGWFGPRGLATVLFSLIALEELDGELPEAALAVMGLTVLASLVLHGATAKPLTARYARWLDRQPDDAPGAVEETTVTRSRR